MPTAPPRPNRPVYLDNQATTRCDPRVVQAMLSFFTEEYGNPHSVEHVMGTEAEAAVEDARAQIAGLIGADSKELVFTSGATESNNIAIKGAARFAGPGDEPIGPHEQRAETKAVLGVAGHVPHLWAPTAVERLQATAPAEVQQQAGSSPQQRAEPRSVFQLEVRAAAAHQRVLFAEVVAKGHTPDTFGEVGRAVARIDQVAEDAFERARMPVRSHQRDLGPRPIENARPDRMPLGGVAVEYAIGGIASDGRRKLPPEVHCVSKSEVQALSAQR